MATVTVLIGGACFLWVKQSDTLPPQKYSTAPGEKLSVVATFYPLQNFAEMVGGDAVHVVSIVPAGTEPHEYEPTPQDILQAYQADVFLLNGAGVDAWAEKIRPELEKRGVKVVEMATFVTPLSNAQENNAPDPHFWLDPVLAQDEIRAIRDALSARDSAREEVYTHNADTALVALAALDTEYRTGLAVCTLRTIVTTHDAFAYLAERYGLKTLSLAGLSPEAEPSPRVLAEMAVTVRQEGIEYIFFETLVSPKVAETLAQETGVKTSVFNPLEGLTDAERQAGENYFTIMRQNLTHLRIALKCQP